MTTEQIWAKYSDDLKRFIISKVKNTKIADDILQDTFIKIHTKQSTLKDVSKLKSWIFTIARNTILDEFKTQNKTVEFNNFEFETELEQHSHTEKDCLRGILMGLPKKYRDSLFLSDIRGLKQQQVADQLKQSLSTTKSQIQRGRKMIVEGFMNCCGYTINENGKLVGEVQEKGDCKVCN